MDMVLAEKDKKETTLDNGKFPGSHRFPFTDGLYPTQNTKMVLDSFSTQDFFLAAWDSWYYDNLQNSALPDSIDHWT